MPPVKPHDPHDLLSAAGRHRMLTRVVHARRRLETVPRGAGRAWINGREVGGSDLRFGHLARIHD